MKIKFVNLNIWEGGRLFDNALEFIKNQQPDVITLQEVFKTTSKTLPARYRTLEVLAKVFPDFHTSYAPTLIEANRPQKVEHGNAVVSRFPIARGQVTFFDIPYGKCDISHPKRFPHIPRNLQHVTVDLGTFKLNVFNVQGIWG